MSDTGEFTLPAPLVDLARRVIEANRTAGRRIAVAESCTGGLVSAALTEIAGSSDVFDTGFVTYSNEAKQVVLGVLTWVVKREPDFYTQAAAVSPQASDPAVAPAVAEAVRQTAEATGATAETAAPATA